MQLYHAYVDGSAYTDTPKKRFGIGGVTFPASNRTLFKAFSQALYGFQNSFSTEAYAIVHALNDLPEGSNVHVFSDLKALCRHIRDGDVEAWSEELSDPIARRACTDLFNAISRQREVSATFVHKHEHSLLIEAHHLARAGANHEPAPAMARIELTGAVASPRKKGNGNRASVRVHDIEESLAAAGLELMVR